MKRTIVPVVVLLSCLLLSAQTNDFGDQNWTNYVRIGGYGLKSDNAAAIVNSATEDGVFGIEVDNDVEGRYESFVDPTEKLAAIHAVAEKAHAVGNKAYVYVAGTECITANAAQVPHSMAKDHPDWIQRKITGEPAIFGGGTAFWIKKGDEDVWVSPYAPGWRKIYMHRIRQIAATGIDGIYVDIPYWMTHFEGWGDSWASFDKYTVAAFHKKTGLDAMKDLKLGDFSDPNFRKWVDFRIQTITDFMHDIAINAKSVNPEIKVIPEIYPGLDEAAPRVGSDVYSLYPVVDAIAHEYEFGDGDHMAAGRSQMNWFIYQVGMHSFRAFAQGKATWILNYSWDGNKNVTPQQPMMNLAMSQVMDGANFWDAPGHSMGGSNDRPTRRKIFAWIRANQKVLYRPRSPIHPIGVYFSPRTRDYDAKDFLESYRGVLILLMQKHLEFQIVTPRTLSEFQGNTLVLPAVRVLNDEEKSQLQGYVGKHKTLVITGVDATGLGTASSIVRFPERPGKQYYEALEKDFTGTGPELEKDFLASLNADTTIQIKASPLVATSISRVDGQTHVFMANFAGLVPNKNPIQTPQTDVEIRVSGANSGHGFFLPFMGERQEVQGTSAGGDMIYKLPAIEKGAIFWYEQ